MNAPEFMLVCLSILVPALLLFYILRRWFGLRERRLEIEALNAAEKAAQYVARSKEVEARLAVVEQIVTDGYSLAYGARFLKRVIDDRIKLPLSQRWKEANSFKATVVDGQVVIETVGPRLVASSDPDAIAV